MLWEEMAKYTELTGEDATHVPLIKLGAYLDGYEKGIEVLDKVRVEIEHVKDNPLFGMVSNDTMLEVLLEIIDKYKPESEDK